MSTELDPDDPRIEMLARASRTITVPPLDAARVVEVARTRRRRRRAGVGSALAVAAVVVGMSVATAGSDSVSKNKIDAADSTEPPAPQRPFPAPPKGMKWVGQNGLVVAVPSGWPVTDSPCGSGAPAEVINGALAASVDCVSPRGKVAGVRITPLVNDPKPPINRSCDLPTVNSTCGGGQIFSEQGIAVQVSVTGDDAADQVERILDSAMVLPGGWTTVPFAGFSSVNERVAALKEAGFEVEVEVGARGGDPVNVSPEFGSPVKAGSTITIAPADVTNTPDTSAPTSRAFDALDMTLLLGEPRPNGDIPSRIRVQNRTNTVVVDQAGCHLFANYASGIVPADQPDAGLLNPNAFIETYCTGPQEIPPGFDKTSAGPTFQMGDLRPGEYLATIDYDGLGGLPGPRSARLTALIEVS